MVSGKAEEKGLQELLPGILNQLGPDNLSSLKALAEQYQKAAEKKVCYSQYVYGHPAHQTVQTEQTEQTAEDEEAPELEKVE